MYYTWLRSFHAVAREGGFTKGANTIGVGQPTVTAQVKSLESAFDVELFHRAGKSAQLTDTGETLYGITRTLFGYQQEAINFLRNTGQSRPRKLRIGAANPNGIMPLIKALRDQLPSFELSVTIEQREEILRRLLDFEIDVAAIGRPPDDPKFATVFYRKLRVDVVVAEDHPWAERQDIRIAELDGQPMILRETESTTRQTFEAAARKAGINIRTEMEINNREAIREAVVLGLGLSVGAEIEFGSHRSLRWLPVRDAEMFIELNLTCLSQRRDRPIIKRFFEIATETQNVKD
jgi:aminoethylphosphonate catabolism LysR family transcriptional regulator